MDNQEELSSNNSLSFGVMCNGKFFHWWQTIVLQELMKVKGVKLKLLIVDNSANETPSPGNALIADMYSEVPMIYCDTIKKGKYSEYFKKIDIEEIKKYSLDFVLRFAFNIIRGEILNVPRYGVWSFHHDDEEKYRGAPAGYWEIYHNDTVTGAILQRLTDRLDGGVVLRKGYFKTIDTSHERNRDAVVRESTGWPAQVCIDIINDAAGYFQNEPSKTSAPIYYYPTRAQRIMMRCKLFRNQARKFYRETFFREQWNVGLTAIAIQDLASKKIPEIHWLPAPESHIFHADPFAGWLQNGATLILCEEYNYDTRRGVVVTLQVINGKLVKRYPLSREQIHLSYPFLINDNENLYCIPESSAANEIALYRITSGQEQCQWEKVSVLVGDFAGVDTTVVRHEGLWWLFVMDLKNGPWHRLHIWYAEDLVGVWRPHTNNPVKMDIRSARSAGTPFVNAGVLYRPAQDCSKTYGGRIVINQVIRLSPTEFQEEPVAIIEPDKHGPYPHGLHTVAALGEMTLCDGKKEEFIGVLKSLRRLAGVLHDVLSATKKAN